MGKVNTMPPEFEVLPEDDSAEGERGGASFGDS